MNKETITTLLEKHVANFFNELLINKPENEADPLQEISIYADLESLASTALEIYNQ